MIRIYLVMAWGWVGLLSGLAWGAEAAFPTRANEDNLTQKFAEFRKSQVSHVAYDLAFTLAKGSKSYQGTTRIHLSLTRTDAPLSIDFVGKAPAEVIVNGAAIGDYVARAGSFDIPARYLKPEATVEIHYSNEFSQAATGFYRAIDPVDQREYLYTDFEPYQAHLLFPCLDQPDLKAPFTMRVTAPAEWKVISNGLASPPKTKGSVAETDFRFPMPISTYLFFLGAGDYHEWRDRYGKVPLFLYSRQSIADHVDASAIFAVTKKGLGFRIPIIRSSRSLTWRNSSRRCPRSTGTIRFIATGWSLISRRSFPIFARRVC